MYTLMSSLALTCYFESTKSRDLSRDQELKILLIGDMPLDLNCVEKQMNVKGWK